MTQPQVTYGYVALSIHCLLVWKFHESDLSLSFSFLTLVGLGPIIFFVWDACVHLLHTQKVLPSLP